MRFLAFTLLLTVTACALAVQEDLLQRPDVREFVSSMVRQHGFSETELDRVFHDVQISDGVLKAISRPAEVLPWYRYRRIFLQPDRIRMGVDFLRDNAADLKRAETAYGVPPEIIAAIIGVETRYGKNTGDYRVIDSLATLAFDYPQRGAFFRGELEQFLLLAREQKLDPLKARGSYAGAMGIPQFIPSSFRRFAVDFDIDGETDIWQDHADAIGSVANYFHEHGWNPGTPVAAPWKSRDGQAPPALTDGLEPDLSLAQLAALHAVLPADLPAGTRAKLLGFETEDGMEYWLGFWNFYVITRYNHSPLYAMAVFQLSREILAGAGKGKTRG